MRKKLLAALLAVSLTAGSVAPVSLPGNTAVVAEAAKKKEPSVKKLYKAIVKKYGDDYLADMTLSEKEIKQRYGISSSCYTDIKAEIPMMSAHVDTLVIARAKNKTSKTKIKKKLTAYRKGLIEDTHQYPINESKIQASKVYVKGNYVFFIMLGVIDRKLEEAEPEEQIKAYQAQNQKAISAINALFK